MCVRWGVLGVDRIVGQVFKTVKLIKGRCFSNHTLIPLVVNRTFIFVSMQ